MKQIDSSDYEDDGDEGYEEVDIDKFDDDGEPLEPTA